MESQRRTAIIGALVAAIAASGVYVFWPEQTLAPENISDVLEEEITEKSAEGSKPTAATPAKPAAPKTVSTASAPTTAGGTYESYTAAAVGYASLGEVVLFFFSPSCPACVLLDRDIITNRARIPKDVKILKVDFESASDLKTLYGVSEPHRLIQVNAAGNRITQWGLSSTLSDLVTRIVRY